MNKFSIEHKLILYKKNDKFIIVFSQLGFLLFFAFAYILGIVVSVLILLLVRGIS